MVMVTKIFNRLFIKILNEEDLLNGIKTENLLKQKRFMTMDECLSFVCFIHYKRNSIFRSKLAKKNVNNYPSLLLHDVAFSFCNLLTPYQYLEHQKYYSTNYRNHKCAKGNITQIHHVIRHSIHIISNLYYINENIIIVLLFYCIKHHLKISKKNDNPISQCDASQTSIIFNT